MKPTFIHLFVLSSLLTFVFYSVSVSQNITDQQGLKQGKWKKNYNYGGIRYEGQFKDDKPVEFGLVFPAVLEIEETEEAEDQFTIAAKEREEHETKQLVVDEQIEKPKTAPEVIQEPIGERETKDVANAAKGTSK